MNVYMKGWLKLLPYLGSHGNSKVKPSKVVLGWVNFPIIDFLCTLRAGLHYGGEGLQSVKNAWPRHGYIRQMVDVPEKN
jgi:hypothetical protein